MNVSNLIGRSIKIEICEKNLNLTCITPRCVDGGDVYQDEYFRIVYSNVSLGDYFDLFAYIEDFLVELKKHYDKNVSVEFSDFYEVI